LHQAWVLGIADMYTFDHMRESPSVELMELLQAKGMEAHHS
jgi:UDP-N-acetyl-D-mannosaminuronate dehydrogenase